MKKIFVFLALLCFAAALSAQVVYIRGSKLMLRYGSENYSVELKGDSIEINGTSFIKMARLFGGDSLLIGNDTVYRGGFYVTDTSGVTTYRTLGDTISEGGGSGIDTGYVKTTGDSMYGYYAHVGDFVFNNMDNIATNGSVAFGNGTDATGVNSAAFGMDAAASGDLSFAAGESSASGYESAAFNTSNAIGDGSFSINSGFSYGTNTFSANQAYAKSYFSTAVGAWNDSTTYTSKTSWILADPLFQVGNGTVVALNDAFRILKNGKTYIGDMSSTTDPIMIVDPTDSTVSINGTLTATDFVVTDTISLADALADSVVTDTLRAGRIYVDDITHLFAYFGDSSVTYTYAASGTWYHLSNATDSLWLYVEKDGFTVSNDTIIMTESGDYQFVFSLSAEGGNGETYKYRFFNVTDNVGVPVGMAMTGRGANNIGNITVNAYCHDCSAGDRFVIQTQSDGTTSTELKSSSIIIKKLHE